MDYKKALSHKDDLEYWEEAEWLLPKEEKLMLSDRTAILLGGLVKEKWRKIVEEGVINRGRRDCAYCLFYLANYCKKCPIAFFSRVPECFGTPYYRYIGTYETEQKQREAVKMKTYVDNIFIRTLLLFDIRKDYYSLTIQT